MLADLARRLQILERRVADAERKLASRFGAEPTPQRRWAGVVIVGPDRQSGPNRVHLVVPGLPDFVEETGVDGELIVPSSPEGQEAKAIPVLFLEEPDLGDHAIVRGIAGRWVGKRGAPAPPGDGCKVKIQVWTSRATGSKCRDQLPGVRVTIRDSEGEIVAEGLSVYEWGSPSSDPDSEGCRTTFTYEFPGSVVNSDWSAMAGTYTAEACHTWPGGIDCKSLTFDIPVPLFSTTPWRTNCGGALVIFGFCQGEQCWSAIDYDTDGAVTNAHLWGRPEITPNCYTFDATMEFDPLTNFIPGGLVEADGYWPNCMETKFECFGQTNVKTALYSKATYVNHGACNGAQWPNCHAEFPAICRGEVRDPTKIPRVLGVKLWGPEAFLGEHGGGGLIHLTYTEDAPDVNRRWEVCLPGGGYRWQWDELYNDFTGKWEIKNCVQVYAGSLKITLREVKVSAWNCYTELEIANHQNANCTSGVLGFPTGPECWVFWKTHYDTARNITGCEIVASGNGNPCATREQQLNDRPATLFSNPYWTNHWWERKHSGGFRVPGQGFSSPFGASTGLVLCGPIDIHASWPFAGFALPVNCPEGGYGSGSAACPALTVSAEVFEI